MKFVVVTGGVVSGLGKGISISSIGVLLQAAGVRVTAIKIDPYLNSDAGTMSPFEHGEVFVLDDGGEADLDLGNYERFLNVTLTKDHNITTGKVYSQVISRERRGDYLGKTVQVVPHVTDAIHDWIWQVAHKPVDAPTATTSHSSTIKSATGASATRVPEVCLVEVGGTVGDIESLVFLEALRQLAARVGHSNICFLHVSLLPVVGKGAEQKTKPTQHSVKELRSVGINPDVLICRSATALQHETRQKLAVSCQVSPSAVLAVHDVPNIYHVPLMLHAQGTVDILAKRLGITLPHAHPKLALWKHIAESVDSVTNPVKIALVGKYTGLQDSYLSVIKSLQHASIAARRKLIIDWVDASALEPAAETSDPDTYKESWDTVKAADGILVPGGFGSRGVEGKIAAIHYARVNKRPFLGICLGMQCAVIEYARNVLGVAGANSAEFGATGAQQLVVFMPEIDPSNLGGTMRLGVRATILQDENCLARELYGRETTHVWERHRHRFEVNPDYVEQLQKAGLHFVGTDDTQQRMEIVELPRDVHPYFFACQYHPEFKSHPHRPSPPFLGFIYASVGELEAHLPFTAESLNVKPDVEDEETTTTPTTTTTPASSIVMPATPPRPTHTHTTPFSAAAPGSPVRTTTEYTVSTAGSVVQPLHM